MGASRATPPPRLPVLFPCAAAARVNTCCSPVLWLPRYFVQVALCASGRCTLSEVSPTFHLGAVPDHEATEDATTSPSTPLGDHSSSPSVTTGALTRPPPSPPSPIRPRPPPNSLDCTRSASRRICAIHPAAGAAPAGFSRLLPPIPITSPFTFSSHPVCMSMRGRVRGLMAVRDSLDGRPQGPAQAAPACVDRGPDTRLLGR